MVPAQHTNSGSVDEHRPISLRALNSLAMHAKIRLMDMIKTHIVKVVKSPKPSPPSTVSDVPAVTASLLETYSRLLVWLGTRNFQGEFADCHMTLL